MSDSAETLEAIGGTLPIAQDLVQEGGNAKCCISRLPPEILGHVFFLVPSRLALDGTLCFPARQTYDLVPLTHACQRWRAIALSISSLWSTICETSPAHIASHVLRGRARQAPLTVYVDRPQASVALTEILASDGHAVTELHLRGLQDESSVRLASELLAFPAPHLRHATVRIRRKPGASAHSAADYEPVIEFWRGTAPKLKTLELHDVPLLPSNHLASLSRLRLSFEFVPLEWNLRDLFEVLSRAPELGFLSLHGLPSDLHLRQPLKGWTSPVSVQRLRCIEIGDCRGQSCPVPLMKAILTHIDLPLGASIRLFGIDARKLSGPLHGAFLPMEETKLEISMTFSALSLRLSEVQKSTSICIELKTGGASKAALGKAIRNFVTEPISSSIRDVTVSSQRAWSSWCEPQNLLSMLPRISVLELRDPPLSDPIVRALDPQTEETGETQPASKALCRELTTVRLPSLGDPSLVERLSSVSRHRSSLGLPRLIARKCRVYAYGREGLRPHNASPVDYL
ncbi:hypothetical protein BV20DRAFT_962424 [Pilatotrama ljubarskyi]|nr:hypothetical protein BV20DRAFT_962424 [Pilatotrama ljubarskyi]